MLNREKLVNVVVFLERAPHGRGGEARAWAQTLEAVYQEIELIDRVVPGPPPQPSGNAQTQLCGAAP